MVLATFRRFAGTPTYLTDPSLEAAVDAALALERPLLVAGESGTGKTQLAQAIAESLSLECVAWPIHGATRAEEGPYVAPRRRVLLIDPIDDGDRAFPNDLVRELDRMRFTVAETGEETATVERPILVITTRGERPLPDALLRRCVFHALRFPDRERMKAIVRVHHPHVDDALVDEAVEAFYGLRAVPRLAKPPSTSELVDWITVLLHAGVPGSRLAQDLPFVGVLLKKERDLELVRRELREREAQPITHLRPARGR